MTRRAARRRRLAEWAAIVAAGGAVGLAVGGIGWAALAAALWLGRRRMVLPPGVAVLLRAHGAPATFFASLDFIEPGETPRDGDGEAAGYMN